MEAKFTVNQKVVYPSQGLGVVKAVEEEEFRGEKVLYYNIYLEVSDMTVMVPVDKAEDLGLRAVVGPKEAEEALEEIGADSAPSTSDWKLRYQLNLELLKKGSAKDIATIVRSLYHRSKIKELPIQERKLYESALKLFVDELSFALDKSQDDVENMIFTRLEKEQEKRDAARKEARRARDGVFRVMHAMDEAEEDEEEDFDDDEDDDEKPKKKADKKEKVKKERKKKKKKDDDEEEDEDDDDDDE
jgi:CarD family transcriptional regulator